MSRPQITIRISDGAIQYRRIVCAQTGESKSEFDQRVYDFFIKHHPLDNQMIETTPREESE